VSGPGKTGRDPDDPIAHAKTEREREQLLKTRQKLRQQQASAEDLEGAQLELTMATRRAKQLVRKTHQARQKETFQQIWEAWRNRDFAILHRLRVASAGAGRVPGIGSTTPRTKTLMQEAWTQGFAKTRFEWARFVSKSITTRANLKGCQKDARPEFKNLLLPRSYLIPLTTRCEIQVRHLRKSAKKESLPKMVLATRVVVDATEAQLETATGEDRNWSGGHN
jgi:hypothetical protein